MIVNPYLGKFIVIEGLDGSGQTTQIKLLTEFLKENGIEVIATKEPTKESPVAEIIKKCLDKKRNVSPRELQELFANDREWHLEEVIVPALKEGKTVISDRYAFSSFAFGCLDMDIDYLIEINDDFFLPDLTIFLDVRAEICLERIKKRGEAQTLFEERKKLEKVRQNFKKLKNVFPIIKINGDKKIGEIHGERVKIVEKFI